MPENKKIAVEYAHIIAHYVKEPCYRDSGNIYYSIKFKPIGEDNVHIGYGSYCLDLVLGWLNTEFEIVKFENGKSAQCVASMDGGTKDV